MSTATIQQALAKLDWKAIEASLWQRGYATTDPLLTTQECVALIDLYHRDEYFRSHIEMRRFRFGEGDYKYFRYPLPDAVQALREELYPHLASVGNQWAEVLHGSREFPTSHARLLAVCRRHGQTKPTPLLLHYTTGGFNCLHQDLYGEIAFPLQLTILLSRPGLDFTGGEFVLVEQRPRAQSHAEVVGLQQGQAIIFTTRYRPVQGSRGHYKVNMRHGVSTIRSGARFTLGVIFHDAK
jgi:uncharacterized protein